MKLDLSIQQIEYNGGLDNLFRDNPRYHEFTQIAESLRADEEFNTDLPPVDGALEGVQKLLDNPFLCIGGYLTTRPFEVTEVTEVDLQKKGFPFAPLITRPKETARELTVQWKLSVLEDLANSYNGMLIMVDDNIAIAEAIRQRNSQAENFIVAILFNGPLTYTTVKQKNIVTCSHEHFYVVQWKDVPHICFNYVGI
jgi:hypothetical protein